MVKGQAIRRREGQASNTLVMAQGGDAAGLDRSTTVKCPVRGCRETYTNDRGAREGYTPTPEGSLNFHLAIVHARHKRGQDARLALGI